MKIRVEYKSDILGANVFWEGSANNIEEIRNIPAKMQARHVARDQKTRTIGMWTVSAIQEDIDNG